ncbi:MAG: rRNA maturation RNase YbeY [Thermoguttaceae bacterium]|nr:rRNA maturation RNase YbeY [Thermoguttaceae bacterium]
MREDSILFEFTDESGLFPIDFDRIERALRAVLSDAGITVGRIELVALAPEPMHRINVEFLGHDYPTDVLAFQLDDGDDPSKLEANIAVCPDVAEKYAKIYDWPRESELLLYAIHGALHLVGYDDHDPEGAVLMHQKEREYLAKVGVDGSRSREGEET